MTGAGIQNLVADDGYRLWLRYDQITDEQVAEQYKSVFQAIVIEGNSPTYRVIRKELQKGLEGLLGNSVPIYDSVTRTPALIVGTPESSSVIASLGLGNKLSSVGNEGFVIERRTISGNKHIVVAANTDTGALYGIFHLLRQLQTHRNIQNISVLSAPRIQHRILNHWDNLNRTVERGYAGLSLWEWKTLPYYKSSRYVDYARANASLGINGTVLNNVNADPDVLTEQYLKKAAALADIFRPYGIKVYLSANFYAPMRIGGLKTADPLSPEVQRWWKEKADEIYSHIPDFGGFW